MEWKVLKLDKTIESTFESEADPMGILEELASQTVEGTEALVYFFYNEGLFAQLIASSLDNPLIRVLADTNHYERFLAEEEASV